MKRVLSISSDAGSWPTTCNDSRCSRGCCWWTVSTSSSHVFQILLFSGLINC